MKHTRRLLNGLVALAVSFATFSLSAANMPRQYGAKVVRAYGMARYHTGDMNWQPVKVGQILQAGSVIETSAGKDGFVDIILGDVTSFGVPNRLPAGGAPSVVPTPPLGEGRANQNVLRIKAGSTISIDKLNFSETGAPEPTSEIQMSLQKGSVFGTVKKMSAASSYDVKLPTGVAGIRGTTFDLGADGSVSVIAGVVTVTYPTPGGTPKVVTLQAGQSANVNVLIAMAISAAVAQAATQAAAQAPAGTTPAAAAALAVQAAASVAGITDPAQIQAMVAAAQARVANLPAGSSPVDVAQSVSSATVASVLPGIVPPPGSPGFDAVSTMVNSIVAAATTPGQTAQQTSIAVQNALNIASASTVGDIPTTTLAALTAMATTIVTTAVTPPTQVINNPPNTDFSTGQGTP